MLQTKHWNKSPDVKLTFLAIFYSTRVSESHEFNSDILYLI